MKSHKFAVFVLSVFVLFGCNQSDKSVDEANTSGESQSQNAIIKTTKQTSKGLEIEYDSITLENGLEVIFHIDRSDPVVAVALTAHVGSAREIPGRTGFAHLFEHLLFLESENLGKGGLDKMSARIGGSGANGSTSRDRTNYFQTVPKNALEKMIWAEADKLGYFINTVTEPVLAKEKQVVKNEKRQSGDNRPYGHTQYVIDKNLYPKGHPYSWQVIGSLQDLQNATLTDVKEFFKRWYVPNNVSLVISGDFDQVQAEQWIHKYFDEIPRGPEVVRTQKQPVILKQSKRLFFEDNFANVPELTITWPTVPLYHPDSYPLQILRSLLSDGKKAPMNQLLVDELKLTSQVRMGNYDSELAGQTSIRVRGFQNTDLNTVYEAIQKGFVNFETNGFSKSDLARIKAEQETAFYQGLSSALGKGFQLAQYQIYVDDPGFINQDVKNILAVTKKDVWRVYSQYIKDKHYIATSFVPKGQKQLALKDSVGAKVVEESIVGGAEDNFDASQQATYTRTKSSFDRSAEPEYDEAPIVVKVPDVWQVTLKNKMGVFSIANNEVPLVNFNLQLDGGMLFENPDKIGVANLVANMMNKGTKRKTPEQLENAIKQLGAQIVFSADKQNIQVSGNTLAKNYLKTMELVTEMLLEPRWDVNEFKLLQESTVSDIKQQLASPRAVASNQFERLLYGEQHLLANNLLGSEQSVTAITLEDLKSYYKNFFSPNLTNLHIVGDISRDIARQSLMSLEKNWLPKDVLIPELKPIIQPEKARVYFYNIPNAKQSMIVIGNPALKATDKDYYPAQVMNYRLGGGSFASQLTQELRESKGYTYGVRSGFIAGKLTGYFQISSGVRANVTFEATQLIKDIASQYQASFSDNDLQVTKGFYSKSNARLFETPNAKLNILSDMSQYSLSADYVQQRADVLERLTLDDIKSLAEKYIQPNKMIYLIVGDAETQLSRMKDLGYGEPVLLNP